MNDDIYHQKTAAEEAKRLARKIRNRLWARKFRREHPEARAHEYQKLKADPERYARRLAYAKRWRGAHPDYQRLWTKRNPRTTNAARKTYIAAWKAAHPDRQREYARRWRLKQTATKTVSIEPKYTDSDHSAVALAAAKSCLCS